VEAAAINDPEAAVRAANFSELKRVQETRQSNQQKKPGARTA
jgi:hypothetical protein